MKRILIFVAVLALCATVGFGKDEEIEFYGYVDSDICSRLYMGPIDAKRVECTKKNYKEGDRLVVTRLRDNTVFEPNKQKNVKEQAGEAVTLVESSATVAGESELDTAPDLRVHGLNAEIPIASGTVRSDPIRD